jgi:GxxExxY protein
VHRILGPGFLESIYEEAMAVELERRRVQFERQRPIGVAYKGVDIGSARLDLVVGAKLVVELKAVDQLLPIHVGQVISYLRIMGQPLGLLINFNVPLLPRGLKRVVLSRSPLARLAPLAVNPPTRPPYPNTHLERGALRGRHTSRDWLRAAKPRLATLRQNRSYSPWGRSSFYT